MFLNNKLNLCSMEHWVIDLTIFRSKCYSCIVSYNLFYVFALSWDEPRSFDRPFGLRSLLAAFHICTTPYIFIYILRDSLLLFDLWVLMEDQKEVTSNVTELDLYEILCTMFPQLFELLDLSKFALEFLSFLSLESHHLCSVSSC
jgi:hypothetical protein